MKWTTKQAAERLHLSLSGVRGLVERGLLKDHAQRKSGAKRHNMLLDSTEVIAFSKTYVRKIHTQTQLQRMHHNGILEHRREATPPQPIKHAASVPPILQRIEAKLDQIIKMWQ